MAKSKRGRELIGDYLILRGKQVILLGLFMFLFGIFCMTAGAISHWFWDMFLFGWNNGMIK